MGTCLSKKKSTSSSSTPTRNNPSSSSVLSSFSVALASSTAQSSTLVVPVLDPATNPKSETKPSKQQHVEEQAPTGPAKKEVFLIKHRKSHDERDRNPKPTTSDPEDQSDGQQQGIRTSSCTKEEVDAILIQCGRLSRSSSGKAASSSATARRYSGSKRSFDFDGAAGEEASGKSETPAEDSASEKRVRERRRHSPSPQGRRRTPSREREREKERDHQRSSSRERRISRSPGRRCVEPSTSDAAAPVNNARPGKMVSVPATVSSLEKSNNNNSGEPGGSVKRISVKRNVGGGDVARTAASPRAQSPARAKPPPPVSSNEFQQQQGASLSRSSSRKAEISPFRRNPLSEIDPNSLAYPNRSQSRGKREAEGADDSQGQKPSAVTNHRSNGRVATDNKTVSTVNLNCAAKEQQQATVETTVVHSGPHTVARTRSARRSRDLDFNPESLLNPTTTPSYTRLLLEDIHNFHQKNGNTAATATTTAVTLPACVSKACSIVEAVADLNNNASSNMSCAFSEDKYNKTYNNLGGPKDPFMESEIVGCDDLMEPSFHKYVTVRRGTGVGDEVEDQESSGSNSFVGGSSSQLSNWNLSPSSWEPNSADTTDCWTSRSREDDRLCGRKRESYGTSGGGIGRGRLGSAKGLYPAPVVAAAAADSTR